MIQKLMMVLTVLGLSLKSLSAVQPHFFPMPIVQAISLLPGNTEYSMEIRLNNTGVGDNYVIQYETNLIAGSWINIQTNQNMTVNPTVDFDILRSNFIPPNYPIFIRVFDLSWEEIFFASGEALIPPGAFTMGDGLDGEADATSTNIYMPAFYIETNLVTYSQWQGVYNWAITNGYSFDNPGSGKGTNYPVEMVDWFDAVKWCNAYSKEAGLTPVYYTDAALTLVYTNGDVVPYVDSTASMGIATNGFRLPTEAEWEKAARGGLNGQRFPWGDTISERQANYDGDPTAYSYDLGPSGFNANFDTGPEPYTSPVGYFVPNGYGLYDMAGNVFEWCWDWYGTPYGQPTVINPTGPALGSSHVIRGGNWFDSASIVRCANRGFASPTVVGWIGFRCVRY